MDAGSPVLCVRLFGTAIAKWAKQRPGCACICSVARLLPEIRAVLERADLAVIDATEDQGQAADALAQAVGSLGAGAAAMYTERMH